MVGVYMIRRIQSAKTPRDVLFREAQSELDAFERREREFSKKERQDLAELRIPIDTIRLAH